ncbi:hypothetical protein EYZ11_008447 [Aspergillus tanneri]|uniref:SPX domain-containing protein n=1 Tax=Aspergillus tanneri TaxID=1220188 RepID=A0A4V3UNQ3_9EURO|nr:hypothetical protein EYZ11_008447 [Aspergillus tanneri]
MRFGQDYHRYQVPEWATFYVPYLSLKRLFNKAVRIAGPTKQQPNFTASILSTAFTTKTINS